jgi:Ni,Fe-hydrogenase III large subunit/NADH:ubiquinone oxidoreductase subunit C
MRSLNLDELRKERFLIDIEPAKVIGVYESLKDAGYRLLAMVGVDRALGVIYVFACGRNVVFVRSMGNQMPSLSGHIPIASFYEREIREMFGIEFEGMPDARTWLLHSNWPKGIYPLRKDFPIYAKVPFAREEYPFLDVEGEGVFQIPVGPVHAGIIEPGHFRFSVAGEYIINLEAKLGYVHKGIEKLAEGMGIDNCNLLAERISGDESFTNSLAFSLAVEEICGVEVPRRAQQTRIICSELERIFCHAGDIAGLCTDVGFGFGTAQMQLPRVWTQQLMEDISGSRYLRNINKPGGLRREVLKGNEQLILEQLDVIEKEFRDTCHILLNKPGFVDRFVGVGILKSRDAEAMNAVGPAGRGSGRKQDVRADMGYSGYHDLEVSVFTQEKGDIYSRMVVKMKEVHESTSLIRRVLQDLQGGEIAVDLPEAERGSFGIGITEAPRGENLHFVVIGEGNTVERYKVRTASFCNWPALCLAVNGNIVPDFPLINKSFNLSYAGNDL